MPRDEAHTLLKSLLAQRLGNQERRSETTADDDQGDLQVDGISGECDEPRKVDHSGLHHPADGTVLDDLCGGYVTVDVCAGSSSSGSSGGIEAQIQYREANVNRD
jgi:hypothetical protein